MALNIPIQAIPNQTFNVVLGQQNCTINIWSAGYDIITNTPKSYLDLFLNNNPIYLGRKLTLTPILPYAYLQAEFIGNLILLNNDGSTENDPNYNLFGISQSLIYYIESDLNVLVSISNGNN